MFSESARILTCPHCKAFDKEAVQSAKRSKKQNIRVARCISSLDVLAVALLLALAARGAPHDAASGQAQPRTSVAGSLSLRYQKQSVQRVCDGPAWT